MKLTNSLVVSLLCIQASSALWPFTSSNHIPSSAILESWDIQDLKNYLSDNSVPFDDKKATIANLKELSKTHWDEQNKLQKSIRADGWSGSSTGYSREGSWFGSLTDGFDGITQKFLGKKTVGDQVGDAIDGTLDSVADSYKDIKSWVFSTWSTNDLQKLLKKANIKYDEAKYKSRSDLIKLAQDKYDDIAKHFKATGKYPGDWLYSSWDTKDLKNWLKDNEIDYSSLKDNRESLVKKVRENAYAVSKYTADQRDSVIENLDLANKNLFDKTGNFKDDLFNSWSTSQLYSWLKSHKVEVEDSIKNKKEELALLAQKNKHELKNDVDSWLSKASKTASPYLSKATSKADNLVNDTFFVGIENWSRDRLESFLSSRNVAIPHFATKGHLIHLVKENKYKPITNFNQDDFFQGWSKANVQKWLSEQGDVATNAGKDIADKGSLYYKQFVDGLGFYANKVSNSIQSAQSGASEYVDSATSAIVDKATGVKHHKNKSAKDAFFDYWSDVELRDYLGSFGIKTHKRTRREDLIQLAKTNTRWFFSGAQYDINNKFADLKFNAASLTNYVGYQMARIGNWVYYIVYGRWF